ncbi:Uncharacterized protein TCAP_06751 [Tolypocladium capitatum]|uniref:Uncharacterized protein n=1 Tax=Tolypocladium capitatum TaxID=45235 RepID=A0A2K3Q745_9HYPO|nr:Uncharacterized protein TCAP_06751 [Tolypocladium capitatum]
MARQVHVHWTQDPRFSHLRNPPDWYNRQATPFWTQKPSARMEKQAAAERKRQWQWQAADGAGDAFDKSCLGATCWPCGIYGRTSSRLRCALSGHDAENIPDPGFCNPDCAQFTMCLPFYGFFLSRLQTTVRSFYGIDGRDVSDWYDGCCCPCITMVRNEHEIILREKQHRRLVVLHDPSSSFTSQYQSPSPMTYDSSASKSSATTSCSRLNGKAKEAKGQSTTPRENDATADQAALPLQRDKGAKPAQDEQLPTITETGQQELARHSLTQDELVAHGIPKAAHGLGEDATARQDGKPSKHLLEHDESTLTPSAESSHRLESDTTTMQRARASGHGLADDQATRTVAPGRAHGLDDDAAVAVTDRSGSKHTLDSHGTVYTPNPGTIHALEDDATMASVGSGGAAHGMEDDGTVDSRGNVSKHPLEAHKGVQPRPAATTAHPLGGIL